LRINVPKVKKVLFLKAHVKGYTKKDGTVVKPHESLAHARAAAEVAGRVTGATGKAAHEASSHALAMTEGATTPATHAAAAAAHEAAAKTHGAAKDAQKYTGMGGMPGSGSHEHGVAENLHKWAAASHREAAAPKRPS
jgi:hypothetical protein